MKTKLCIGIFLLAAATLRAQTNDLTALLQQGLFEEQANRNLDAAITAYQSLALQFDKDRQLAATAVFRLGECYRAQGRTNEAAAQYHRILRDFSDQQTLATLSRQDLAGMGMTPETSTATARQQQKDLLAKQIALAEQDLSETQKRFQTGVATQADARAAEREVLRLRQQLAALEANNAELVDLSAPVTSDEDQEITRIQQMIQNSPDLINAPADGSTPLVKAAYNGWLKVAAYLLDHGADVNVSCSGIPATWEQVKVHGPFTPLAAAVVAGNKAMAKFLIDRDADINFKSQNGDTPLSLAAGKGFQAVAEVLLASHADVNAQNNSGMTPLFSAVQAGQLKIVQMLLAAGANVNLKDQEGQTVLNYAIRNSPEIVQALVDAKTNPNTQDWSGRPPLSYAADGGDPQMVKLLLAAKADPNLGSLDAPLLCAIHKNDVAIAESLLQAGANPNVKGVEDWEAGVGGIKRVTLTPMFLAVSDKQFPLVRLLLKYKTDPNDSQTDGQSVLFSALDKPDIIKALLDAGADAGATNAIANRSMGGLIWHETLLQTAANQNQGETVELLLQHGANPDICDERGNSALYYAAFNLADEKVFASLLDHKANPNARNNDGKTPLDILKQGLQSGYPARFGSFEDKKAHVEKLIALLHQRGALDNPPDWNRIILSRPGANYSWAVFSKNTNNWNHFTLLEAIYHAAGWGPSLNFPDLAHIIIARPIADDATIKRISVNLLDASNHVDCARDVPLEFGDVVEIPEREHSLAEGATFLTGGQVMAILNYFRGQAGEAKLIVSGGQTVQLPLQPFHSGIGEVLQLVAARAALTSNSDLSRVKVIRHDAKTNQQEEWTLDCSNQSNQPDLWLRVGDVIEVPLKP